MSRLTVDNRHMEQQEDYLMDRIEALKRRVKELELENATLKAPKVRIVHDRSTYGIAR